MTTSHHSKVLKQIKDKPGKYQKYLKHNTPKKRKHGKGKHTCDLCGSTSGVIRKYGMKICRQCFRDNATNLGFKKYS